VVRQVVRIFIVNPRKNPKGSLVFGAVMWAGVYDGLKPSWSRSRPSKEGTEEM
jgi:hypothetical protein